MDDLRDGSVQQGIVANQDQSRVSNREPGLVDEPPTKRARTRARRGASCRICRQRKLRCDGVKPRCSRCIKAGDDAQCIYDLESKGEHDHSTVYDTPASPELNYESHAPAEVSDGSPQERRIRELEHTVQQLQRMLGNAGSGLPVGELIAKPLGEALDLLGVHSIGHPLEQFVAAGEQSRAVLLGEDSSFRTFFWGSAYWGVAPVGGLASVQEAFIAETQSFKRRHATLGRASKELKQLNKVVKASRKAAPSVHSDPLHLWKMFPSKDKADQLIDLYIRTLENVHHVLHLPSFRKQYNALWQQPEESHVNSAFLCVVLLMMGSVISIDASPTMEFVGDDSVSRAKAVAWVLACDEWIRSHSQKYLTLEYFQVRCLLIISKMIVGTHIKRWYVEVGELTRMAISVGLNLEVEGSKIGKVMSTFDKEARRRLWAVITELELLVCMLRGLPSILPGIDTTCAPPQDVHDEDLHPLNMPMNDGIVTPSRLKPIQYLVFAGRSRELRLRLLAKLNNPSDATEAPELIKLEDEITAALKQTNDMNTGSTMCATTESLPRIQLRMWLFRLMLLLNRHVSIVSTSESTRRYAVHRCTEIATTMIKEHQEVDQGTRLLLTYFHAPIFTAAMSLCLDLTAGPSHFSNEIQETCNLIEYALNTMEIRALRLNGVYRRYWLLHAAFATLRMRLNPAKAKEIDERAAEKLTSVLYKIISHQVSPADAVPQHAQPAPLAAFNQTGSMFDQPVMDTDFGLADFDFGSLSNLSWDVFSANQ